MAGFEDLIRGALEKQGEATPERRKAIYQSSRQALERMLSQNTKLDAAAVSTQRTRLETAIREIEADYVAKAAPKQPVSAPTPSVAPPPRPTPQPAPQPRPAAPQVQASAPAMPAPKPVTPVAEPTRREPAFAPVPDAPVRDQEEADVTRLQEHAQEYDGDLFKERKPYAKMLLWTIILVGLGIALWWAVTFGPKLLREKLEGSVPNPTPSIEQGGFVPGEGDGWISIFTADGNPEDIETGSVARAELIRENGVTFARLVSNPGSSGNKVLIKIPRGVTEQIKGQAATFELMVRSSEENPQEFAIYCEFKDLGKCGRKRFKSGKRVEAYIFDVLVNDAVLPEGQNAHIALGTDLNLTGKSIDLYSVRVRVGK